MQQEKKKILRTNLVSAPNPEIFSLMQTYDQKCKGAQREYQPSVDVQKKQKALQEAIQRLQASYITLHNYGAQFIETKSANLRKEMQKKNKIIVDDVSKEKAIKQIKDYGRVCHALLEQGKANFENYMLTGETPVDIIKYYQNCFNRSQLIKQLQQELSIYNQYLKNLQESEKTEEQKRDAINKEINQAILKRKQETQVVSDATYALIHALKNEDQTFSQNLDRVIEHATMCNRVQKFIEGYQEASRALQLTYQK